jgi:hypothetical protein
MTHSIDLAVLLICTLTGFLVLRKSDPRYLVLFPYFLSVILIVELIGEITGKKGINNLLLYNLFSVIEFSFFIYFFSRVIPNEKIRRVIGKIGFLLPVACLLNIFFIQGPTVFNTYTFMAGCVSMIVLSIIYYYQSFNHATGVNRLREPSFWINTGIIFFFVCAISSTGALNSIAVLPAVVRKNIRQILFAVNAIFYLTFFIAFICQINIRKSSSSS